MLKERRQKRIMSLLYRDGLVDLNELARIMPEVSRVTLRRDISELAETGALKRTHGGAILHDREALGRVEPATDAKVLPMQPSGQELADMDAVVLPPLEGRGSDALRRQLVRRGIPFLAESAPQPGGVYLGPDNFKAGHALGRLAGQSTVSDEATVLLVCQRDLANTRARADGFAAGFEAAFGGRVTFMRVDGKGAYRSALRVVTEALAASEDATIGFGVNDHSALALIDAAASADRSMMVYACGGESPGFVGRLAENGPLQAVAAFFPELVGTYAIDLIADAMRGGQLPTEALTPHAIVSAQTLQDFYVVQEGSWRVRADVADQLPDAPMRSARIGEVAGRVGFMPHYPAHDWYRAMGQAIASRCKLHGLTLLTAPPHQGIAAELSRLRRLLAQAALQRIERDSTIILGEGEATLLLAEAIRARAFDDPTSLRGVTVITNALDILSRLEDAPEVKTILTSGEYQAADRCLVGPSVGALFEQVRADIAFLSVAGISAEFGISAVDQRLALAGSRFAQAARRTIALADHTLVGTDANHRIARADAFDELITDDGALPGDRQRLRAAGIDVFVADEPATPEIGQPLARAARFAS
ncbi:MAG: substrate-binding domain-containing protein [Pseudomonadota bacterium]